jgi:hypothetical protein
LYAPPPSITLCRIGICPDIGFPSVEVSPAVLFVPPIEAVLLWRRQQLNRGPYVVMRKHQTEGDTYRHKRYDDSYTGIYWECRRLLAMAATLSRHGRSPAKSTYVEITQAVEREA